MKKFMICSAYLIGTCGYANAEALSIPEELRNLPAYDLPGSSYGLIYGSPGIPHFNKPVAGQKDLIRALLEQRHELDILSVGSDEWKTSTNIPLEMITPQWAFAQAGTIDCPAPSCLLLGGPSLKWIVTADDESVVIEHALVSAYESRQDENTQSSKRSVMDSIFGWGGDRADHPLDFAASGIFCSNFVRERDYRAKGDEGAFHVFMRQITPDGRILSKEIASWDDCHEGNAIEPVASRAGK